MLGIGTKRKVHLVRNEMHLLGHQLQLTPRENGASTFMSKSGEIMKDCLLK